MININKLNLIKNIIDIFYSKNGEIIDNYRKALNENLKLTNELKILGANENSEITKLNLKLNEDLLKEKNKVIQLEKKRKKL